MVGDTGPYFTVWYNTVLILYDLESSSRNISTDPGDICLKLEVKHTGCGQTFMLAWKLLGANIILWVIKYVVLQMCLQISCLFFLYDLPHVEPSFPPWVRLWRSGWEDNWGVLVVLWFKGTPHSCNTVCSTLARLSSLDTQLQIRYSMYWSKAKTQMKGVGKLWGKFE